MSTISLGKRALEFAMEELFAGAKEDPMGSNGGAAVRKYLLPCVRGDNDQLLGLRASNWCAAFASWCQKQALLPGERPAHGYRAGVVEIVADVMDDSDKWSGSWHPIGDVMSGVWVPEPGDLAIYDRSQPGRPDTSWWRHVNRVLEWLDDEYVAIGGNENDTVTMQTYHISNPKLLGFIAYPRAIYKKDSKPMLTDEERKYALDLVAISIDGMLRDMHKLG